MNFNKITLINDLDQFSLVNGDSRCVGPTRSNVTKLINSATYFSSGFGHLGGLLDSLHKFINQEAVPEFMYFDLLFNERKIRNLFSSQEIQFIRSTLRRYYPSASKRSCNKATEDDMKAIVDAFNSIPKVPPVITGDCEG